MYIIEVYTSKRNRVMLEVKGDEAAWAAYNLACDMADLTGASVKLWEDDSGDTLAEYNKEED